VIHLFLYGKSGTREIDVDSVSAAFDAMKSEVLHAIVEMGHADMIRVRHESGVRMQAAAKAAELANAVAPSFEFMNVTGQYALPGHPAWRITLDRVLAEGRPQVANGMRRVQ